MTTYFERKACEADYSSIYTGSRGAGYSMFQAGWMARNNSAVKELAVWKQLAEEYYGKLQYPDSPELAQGALNALAAKRGAS